MSLTVTRELHAANDIGCLKLERKELILFAEFKAVDHCLQVEQHVVCSEPVSHHILTFSDQYCKTFAYCIFHNLHCI